MKRNIFLLLFSFCLSINMVWAITYNGTCGDDLKWVLDTETGLLVISGTGAMTNFAAGSQPWYPYRTHITGCRIEAGCTSVAPNAFYNCTKLVNVSYPLSLDNTFPEFECSQKEPPVVLTKDATNVTSTTATINGKITSGSDATYGFCWGTNLAALTNCDNRGVGTGDFHWDITGLTPNTTYYFGAFASNEVGSDNGEFLSFTTPKAESTKGKACDHEWVQLWEGGPKWATVNLGASDSLHVGDYYLWGETEPAGSCTWRNYIYAGTSQNTSPYSKYGLAKDGNLVLSKDDDAAAQQWGCQWRIPTKEEWEDLIKKCTWTYKFAYSPIKYGGYLIKSKEPGNNNSIFLPLTGYKDGTTVHDVSKSKYWGRYLSSTSSTTSSKGTYDRDCYILYFYPDQSQPASESYGPAMSLAQRYLGQGIRPVLAE